ncbi:TrmB family transcriptional regulator [Bordetella sp. H567]|uniref:TrmB family transcriptional regulator n=1 Tax=Bordetella sp. H567 TaxID=1697043 RepID=UPI00082C4DE3|nr:helix-turn-helix domain-containing protein [Bordetella sp. H567]
MAKSVAAKSVAKPRNGAGPVQELQRLGFSEYEASAYISLLQASPATAYEISKRCGLPRANTYGALEGLAKKRAVQPVSQNPARYVPVDPTVLLGEISGDINDTCGRLKQSLDNLVSAEDPNVVWSIEGQERIQEKIHELIDGASEQIWIKASTDILRQYAPRMKKAARRGVKLIFVVFGDDVEFLRFGANTQIYLHEGNGFRVGGSDNLFTLAIDYRVALTANLGETLTGAYTTHSAIVRMAETLIRHDIYMAEMMSAFGSQIEGKFGKALVNLRTQLFSPQQMALLRANMPGVDIDKAGKKTTRSRKLG